MNAEVAAKRKSIFTASEMYRLMAGSAGYKPCEMSDKYPCFEKIKTDNGFEYVEIFEAPKGKKLIYRKDESYLPEGAVSYVLEKCCEVLAPQEKDGYKSAAMQLGNEREMASINAIERAIGRKFACTGDDQFCFDNGVYGCTPDGIMYADGGIDIEYGLEVKNPNSTTHLFNLLNLKNEADLKKHYPEYYWQCMTALSLLDCGSWVFASFDDNFDEKNQLLMLEVPRNDIEISMLRNRVRLANELKQKIINTYF